MPKKSIIIYAEDSLYVSPDGNYGEADELAIIPTGKWTEEDFDVFECLSDSRRWDYAEALQSEIEEGKRSPIRPAQWEREADGIE